MQHRRLTLYTPRRSYYPITLTIFLMLSITSPRLMYFVTWSSYFLIPFPHFASFPTPILSSWSFYVAFQGQIKEMSLLNVIMEQLWSSESELIILSFVFCGAWFIPLFSLFPTVRLGVGGSLHTRPSSPGWRHCALCLPVSPSTSCFLFQHSWIHLSPTRPTLFSTSDARPFRSKGGEGHNMIFKVSTV